MKNQEFREEYRAQISKSYKGLVHLFSTITLSILAMCWCIYSIDEISGLEWLTIPVAFLYTNIVEYLGHRFVMHKPRKGLKEIYRRHSKQHHIFFTHESMKIDNYDDLHVVLFPLMLAAFFFGIFGVPAWFLLNFLFGSDVAWLSILVGVAYFLLYEFLHASYHLDEKTWIYKVPGFMKLRNAHLNHHRLDKMHKYNFNVNFPISDILFRTYIK